LIHAHEHGDYTSQAASYTNDLGAVFFDMGQSERVCSSEAHRAVAAFVLTRTRA